MFIRNKESKKKGLSCKGAQLSLKDVLAEARYNELVNAQNDQIERQFMQMSVKDNSKSATINKVQKRKRWKKPRNNMCYNCGGSCVLFTCMASRAVHVEVSNPLITDSFLNSYRRLVSRRGQVWQLRSDQGTNFIGAKSEFQKALNEMENEVITRELLENSCDYVNCKMNQPHTSHMGGV